MSQCGLGAQQARFGAAVASGHAILSSVSATCRRLQLRSLAMVQGEAAGHRLTADSDRSEGSAALSNGRHVLQFSNNLRTAHSPVPAPAATVNEAISKTSGRHLLGGAGPGARVYNDQGATQGVNVVRPVASAACCAQAGYGWWNGAKSLRSGLSCGGACPVDCVYKGQCLTTGSCARTVTVCGER